MTLVVPRAAETILGTASVTKRASTSVAITVEAEVVNDVSDIISGEITHVAHLQVPPLLAHPLDL